jgi:FtsZ-interacting cell division protein ZipA
MLMVVLPLLGRRFFPSNSKNNMAFLLPIAEKDKKTSTEKKQIISDVSDISLLPTNNKMYQKELFSEFSSKTIIVIAKSNQFFRGYELLQALQNVDLIYGEKELFHYFCNDEILFSVSPLTEPYTFDLHEMGAFMTTGLKFSIKNEVDYQTMKNIAEMLTEELEGQIQEFNHA